MSTRIMTGHLFGLKTVIFARLNCKRNYNTRAFGCEPMPRPGRVSVYCSLFGARSHGYLLLSVINGAPLSVNAKAPGPVCAVLMFVQLYCVKVYSFISGHPCLVSRYEYRGPPLLSHHVNCSHVLVELRTILMPF